MTASVAVAYTAGLFESLQQHQQLDAALARVGLATEQLRDPDYRIAYAQYIDLWNTAVELCQRPLLGLEVGGQFHPGNLGNLGSLLMAAPNLLNAIEQLVRFEHLLQDGIQTLMSPHPASPHIEFTSTRFDDEQARPAIEKEIAEAIAVARFLLQHSLSPVQLEGEVWFKHSPAAPLADYQKLIGSKATIRFNQSANRLIFPAELLTKPNSFGNADVFNSVLKAIDQQTEQGLCAQVKRAIGEQLHQGVPDVKTIAEAFGMSHRTFQRRLSDQGTSYKTLVAELRKEKACDMLSHSKQSISEIAYLLGFTEASTFHQAFKRWTELSPGEYRRSHS